MIMITTPVLVVLTILLVTKAKQQLNKKRKKRIRNQIRTDLKDKKYRQEILEIIKELEDGEKK